MHPKHRRLFFRIALVFGTLLCTCAATGLLASQWIHIVSASNYTLSPGETIPSSLWLLSQNVTLAEDSAVDGSVLMLCCNLTVEGTVKGDIFLLTGNLTVSRQADVDGEVGILSGNLSR